MGFVKILKNFKNFKNKFITLTQKLNQYKKSQYNNKKNYFNTQLHTQTK